MCYGVFILTRLFYSTMTNDDPIAKILDLNSFELNEYLEQRIPHLIMAAEGGYSRVASRFLMVLMKLAAWYYRQNIRLDRIEVSGEPSYPLTNLRRDATRLRCPLRSEGTVPDLREGLAQSTSTDILRHPHVQTFGSSSKAHLNGNDIDRYISQQHSTQTNQASTSFTTTPFDYN